MRYEKISVKCEGSHEDAALYTYLLDDSVEILIKKRPMVVICPGGGYTMTSDREAEMIAMQLLSMGYHAAILRYSVAPVVFPTALLELGKSISCIREHAKEWHIDSDKILVAGFSAGGHLAASFCCFWSKPWVVQKLGVDKMSLQPNGMILGYPVITSGEFAHDDSFKCLLGEEYEEKKDSVSLEKCVNEYVPRAFIWHTFEDGLVPVQNSLLLVEELTKRGISTEFHMYSKGGHGLSLANRLTQNQWCGIEPSCQSWVELLKNWMETWYVD